MKIVKMQEPTKIPDTSSYILGVIKYDDTILPIADLSERFFDAATSITSETKIVVCQWKDKKIGLVVDNVVAIRTLEQEYFEEINEQLKSNSKYINGFFKQDGGIVLVLNISELFSMKVEEELLSLMNV